MGIEGNDDVMLFSGGVEGDEECGVRQVCVCVCLPGAWIPSHLRSLKAGEAITEECLSLLLFYFIYFTFRSRSTFV